MKTRKLTQMALLTAIALTIFMIEAQIPALVPIPGIKLGLANLIIVWALYTMTPGEALAINGMRILLVGFMFSSLSMILYSLAGALLSFLCMYLAKRSGTFSEMGVSMIGGVMHNAGQLIVAMLVLETVNLMYYGPVLLVAGLLTGFLIGTVTHEVLKRVPMRPGK